MVQLQKNNNPGDCIYDNNDDNTTQEQLLRQWRADPEESFSDWTIEIVHQQREEDGQEEECNRENAGIIASQVVVDVYHVHKVFLAFGKRKSYYFVHLFHNGQNFKESESSKSRIELHPLAAKAFPQLLDFLYSPVDKPLQTDVEHAAALCHLGEYFEIDPLVSQALEFCKNNMTVKNVETFYSHAKIFQIAKLQTLVAQFLVRKVMSSPFGPSSPSSRSIIVKKSDPSLWVDMLYYEGEALIGWMISLVLRPTATDHDGYY